MIRRVHIRGYKSLEDVEIDFAALTVVLGPNAAGKSNLLDALALLARMVTREDLEAAFEDHRGLPLEAFTLHGGGLAELQERGKASFTIEADVELSDAVVAAVEDKIMRAREGLPNGEVPEKPASVRERLLRYSVTVEIRTTSGHLRIVNERLAALKRDGTENVGRRPFLEKMGNRLHLRMEKQAHPLYEDIGQDRTIASRSLYAPYYPHLAAFKEELSRWRFYFLEPSAMRQESPLKESTELGATGDDVAAFYNTLKTEKPAQFNAISIALRHLIPGVESIDVERTKEGFVRLTVDEAGRSLSSRLISEGTLRILGLLAVTNPLDPLAVVGFEEPENGVHPRRLSIVARILSEAAERGNTQFIINTHSPVLPEYFLDSSNARLVACRKDGRATVFEAFDTEGPLFQPQEIEAALDEPQTPLRDRLIRGDFGG